MARQKEFDREQVLDRALDAFWHRGYEATSVQELVDCMGIGRGSLYDTFGDKRTLFLATLDRYQAVTVAPVLQLLDAPGSGLEAIREVFQGLVRDATACAERRGCLLTNAAVELAPHDPEIRARISANLAQVEAAFHRAVLRARARGEIPDGHDPRALARFLTNSLLGLRVTSRAAAEPHVLRDVVEVTLRALV